MNDGQVVLLLWVAVLGLVVGWATLAMLVTRKLWRVRRAYTVLADGIEQRPYRTTLHATQDDAYWAEVLDNARGQL